MTNIIPFNKKQKLFHTPITSCENLLAAISEVGYFSNNQSQKILRIFSVTKPITLEDIFKQLHRQYEKVFENLQAVIKSSSIFSSPYTYDETTEIYSVLEIVSTKDIQSFITSSMYLFIDKVHDYANEYPKSVKYQSKEGEILYCPLKTSTLDIQKNLSFTDTTLLSDKKLMVAIVRKSLNQESKKLLEERMDFLHIFLDELIKAHARVVNYANEHSGYDELITYSNKEQKKFTDVFRTTTLDRMVVDAFILSGSE